MTRSGPFGPLTWLWVQFSVSQYGLRASPFLKCHRYVGHSAVQREVPLIHSLSEQLSLSLTIAVKWGCEPSCIYSTGSDHTLCLLRTTPTSLGVTFDKRLIWKQRTETAEDRSKVRLAFMKKLAGTTWGAGTVTLKRLYTGRVRPVLEYGMTAWGTTAKSNFDRVSKVQNQATRIITGAMKSTPIMELETITGLQSLDDRRDLKLLSQAAKLKRLQDHPMRQRLSQPTKGRLKRESFVHQSRMLERRQEGILDHDPKEIPPCLAVPAWSGPTSPVIRCTIPGVSERLPKRPWEKVPHSGIP